MKVINAGTRYEIYPDDLKTYDQLPAGTYKVIFNPMSGFSLIRIDDFEITEKIYGKYIKKVDKTIRTFNKAERNLGVILSGEKGVGKSLFARALCEKAIKEDLPVIIVDKAIPNIGNFIDSIEQNIVVLFDEFEKIFPRESGEEGSEGKETQTNLLSLFDGISQGKKLFMITINSLYSLNEYMRNRPGRFHYHYRVNYPDAEEIREYLTDKISIENAEEEIDKIILFAKKAPLNYDCLRAIVFELEMGEKFEEIISDLNIEKNCVEQDIIITFKNGMVIKATDEIDFWAEEDYIKIVVQGDIAKYLGAESGSSKYIDISLLPNQAYLENGYFNVPLNYAKTEALPGLTDKIASVQVRTKKQQNHGQFNLV